MNLSSIFEVSILVFTSVNQNPFLRKNLLIIDLDCSMLASVIATPGTKLISSFRSLRSDLLIPSSLYSSKRGCSFTLINREIPVNDISLTIIFTSENKPTLYNLFIASGIFSPGKVIFLPEIKELAFTMNWDLVFSFPCTITVSIVYSVGKVRVGSVI